MDLEVLGVLKIIFGVRLLLLAKFSAHWVGSVNGAVDHKVLKVSLVSIFSVSEVHETEAGGGSGSHGDILDVGSGVSVTNEVGSTVRVVVVKLGVEVEEDGFGE